MNDLAKLGLIVAGALLLFKFLSKYQITAPEGYAGLDPVAMLPSQVQTQSSPMSQQMAMMPTVAADRGPPPAPMPMAGPALSAPAPAAAPDSYMAGAYVERPKECFPRDQLSADDLLPKDNHSRWAKVNPDGDGDLQDQNFLSAGYQIGIDSVGQSLRNASHDLRSSPPNPQLNVSVWNQSTIGPDTNRRPFEIGGDY
jgi:hypothetical protein